MLAIVNEATVPPSGVDAAAATVRGTSMPQFVERDGAVEGIWMADRSTGRLLTVTIWSELGGPEVGPFARVLGLRPADVDGSARWARVTRVDGLAAVDHATLEALHHVVSADQTRSEGFCGSCWLGDEHAGQVLTLSLWDGPHALIRGEHDSKRRRLELERRFGARVTRVSELECLGIAVAR